MRRLLEGDTNQREALISSLEKRTIFNVKAMSFFSFKIRMKHKSSLTINQIYWKTLNINNIFIPFFVCILVPYTFWFSLQQNIVTILIIAVFRGAVLIRGETHIRGSCLFQCEYPKVWRLLVGGTYLRHDVYQRKYCRCDLSIFEEKYKNEPICFKADGLFYY